MTGLEPPSNANASLLMPSGRFIFSGLAFISGLDRSSAPGGPRGTPRMSLTSACSQESAAVTGNATLCCCWQIKLTLQRYYKNFSPQQTQRTCHILLLQQLGVYCCCKLPAAGDVCCPCCFKALI